MNKAFNKVIKSHMLLAILTVVAAVLLTTGVAYSLFQINFKNTKNQTIAIGDLSADITSISGALVLNDLYPETANKITNDDKKYTFTISNSGTYDLKYKVYFMDTTKSFLETNPKYSSYKNLNSNYYKFINYKLDGQDGVSNLESIHENSKFTILSGTLKPGESIDHYIQFFLDAKDTTTTGAPNDISGSILSLDIYFDAYVSDTVVDNIIASTSDKEPTFKESGVFKKDDDYGTSYYYRGNVNNNYVQFANLYWRIVRINGDGTMRLMYDGTRTHKNGETNQDRALELIEWNTSKDDAKYVGYMYGEEMPSNSKENASNNKESSNIKTALDAWYKTNIVDKGFGEFVADRNFCNDRTTGIDANIWYSNDTTLGYGNNVTYYGGFGRFNLPNANWNVNNKPVFTCSNTRDTYTVSVNKGNGSLTYPVGLITMDELVTSGFNNLGETDTESYIYKGIPYWTMTPSSYDGNAKVYSLSENGEVNISSVDEKKSIVPVINLTSEYSSKMQGTGSVDDPFRLS